MENTVDFIVNPIDLGLTGFTVAGGQGNGAGISQLNRPFGIYVDDAGNVYVADSYNNRIQKWAPGSLTGITVAGGNGGGPAANQLLAPEGIFVDKSGNMYITDLGNSRVQKMGSWQWHRWNYRGRWQRAGFCCKSNDASCRYFCRCKREFVCI